MDDKKWMKEIQDSAENVEVPKSLEPEEMEKRLKGTRQERRRFPVYRVGGVAAALLVLAVGVWQAGRIAEDGTVKGNETAKSRAVTTAETGGSTEAEMAAPENAAEDIAEEQEMLEDTAEVTLAAAPESAAENATGGSAVSETAAPENAAEEAAEESALAETGVPENTDEDAATAEAATSAFHPAESYDELYEKLKENFYSISDTSDTLYARGVGVLLEGEVMEDASADVSSMSSGTMAIESAAVDESSDYSKTNLQELGVDEGDVVKTDGQYFYILDTTGSFRIIQADGSTLTQQSETAVPDQSSSVTVSEMYLDGDRLTLIGTTYEVTLDKNNDSDTYWMNEQEVTQIYTYDISDRTAPVLAGQTSLSGSYRTSRKNGNYLYVFSEYFPVLKKERSGSIFIPLADGEALSADDIYLPYEYQSSSYLVAAAIDLENPDTICDQKAFVSGASDYYVSQENIYIVMNQWTESGGNYTKILRCAYQDGQLTPEAAGAVKGYLNNSFSMNEWNGNLRVVTTVYEDATTKNALYVLDEEMNVCGQITDLAQGETIQSARFLQDTGYFVTYRNVDPLFSVDLSDPENPTILGELKVTGFSSYLHFYGTDRLLGIGYETDPDTGISKGIKLSMFDVSDPSNVTEICKYVIEDTYSCPGISNYKAILADPEKNLIGLAVDTNYLVFSYTDADGFQNQMAHSLKASQGDYVDTWDLRGCYIGDTFYLVSDEQITAFDMAEAFAETEILQF
ncbi:MAG: beta-propeller domain-containing protein [Eubacteriales bacterium]|nr:beta-propeller domain-containing protein [Eubacteriales bacterium]